MKNFIINKYAIYLLCLFRGSTNISEKHTLRHKMDKYRVFEYGTNYNVLYI